MAPECLQSLKDAGCRMLVDELRAIHHNGRLNLYLPQANPYLGGVASDKIVKWLDELPMVLVDTQWPPAPSHHGRARSSHTKDHERHGRSDLWTGASETTIRGRSTASRSPSPRKHMGRIPAACQSVSQSPPRRLSLEKPIPRDTLEPWEDIVDSSICPFDSLSVGGSCDSVVMARSILTILQAPKEPNIYPDCTEHPTISPGGDQKSTRSDLVEASNGPVPGPSNYLSERSPAIAKPAPEVLDLRALLL
ncbi:hypothetical protein BJ875DRAFT_487321 [Amylocarpus encephaloides]|uniref:Uncharacterized protein n=1 Tax=Amylocarpus encephaloides TaxID=45428 RepID=A0A9P8C254_9HELO|nr:hypothetical protein BJ875DRAFT_487321 [Amylocarpus encephaloides]